MSERIKELVKRKTNSGINVLDIYTDLFVDFLKDAKDINYLNLQKIIELSDTDFDLDWDTLDDKEKKEVSYIGIKYQPLIKNIVSVLTINNDCPKQFYQRLFHEVFESELLKFSDREFGIVLFILSNLILELPYYQAKNTVLMDDKEYSEAISAIKPQINKGLYMLNNRLDSYTEQASQLHDIAESFGDRQKAIVFWAVIISNIKKEDDDSK